MVSDFLRDLVRDRVQASMDSEVQVLRGAPGAFDPATGHAGGMSSPQTLYQGMARIPTVQAGTPIAAGDAEVATRQATISVPITAPVARVDDLVKVITCPSDPTLDGVVFRVDAVDGGGLLGDARRLSCTSLFPSGQWSPA